jgi:integrase
MQPQTGKKAFKGTVSIEEFQGRLRLRWRFEGKRYTFSIGLPDSKVNRKVAQQKATIIELDIASGHFDPSLNRYKPEIQSINQISVVTLFGKFIDSKAKVLEPKSLDKYQATLGYLTTFFCNRTASSIDAVDAEKLIEWLNNRDLSPIVLKERLIIIRAAWEWAMRWTLLVGQFWGIAKL